MINRDEVRALIQEAILQKLAEDEVYLSEATPSQLAKQMYRKGDTPATVRTGYGKKKKKPRKSMREVGSDVKARARAGLDKAKAAGNKAMSPFKAAEGRASYEVGSRARSAARSLGASKRRGAGKLASVMGAIGRNPHRVVRGAAAAGALGVLGGGAALIAKRRKRKNRRG